MSVTVNSLTGGLVVSGAIQVFLIAYPGNQVGQSLVFGGNPAYMIGGMIGASSPLS